MGEDHDFFAVALANFLRSAQRLLLASPIFFLAAAVIVRFGLVEADRLPDVAGFSLADWMS